MDQHKQAQAERVMRIIQSAERKIWVTFQKEGIHCYPAAATDPTLNTNDEYNVAFLASPHRHMFHFRVCIDVFHSDRDIEFIQFKRWLENLYSGTGPYNNNQILDLNHKSCEMIADELYVQIAARYPERAVWIEIAEDGENGCLIKYEISRPNLSIKI